MNKHQDNYRLFFSQCVLCKGRTKRTQGICSDCVKDLPWIKHHCPCCFLPQEHDHLCQQCSAKTPAFQSVSALFDYQFPVNQLIAQIKYHDKPVYMAALAELMARHLSNAPQPDVLIPVPLHRSRLRERGYNQAEILARGVGRQLGIPVRCDLLSKTRATAQQMSLDRSSRQKNLKAAFECRPYSAQHIVLIDDVMTTGTTVREICKHLRQSPQQVIDVWVLVRTAEDR
ncbi:ComF family protein [Pontibacterium sp. N1Y112]|uniref:ComF family protein n=1 Tax=Pontibacterium sinense TaxID=2781979 RepID=A0A8J7FB79_9GAMM|nr:ComF family protein [Pontibacterium sinense]MBE9396489.1 ComF family protein [Pontibacterium sinense]